MTIVDTIRDQIGPRAFVMLGARDLVAMNNRTLKFRVGRNEKGVGAVTVELAPDDTYTVRFWKVSRLDWTVIGELSMVYVNSLREVIGDGTGMAVSL